METKHDGDFDSSLQRFILFETKTQFFITGSNKAQTKFRILTIDRTCPDELKLVEDPTTYSAMGCQARMDELLGNQVVERKTVLCGILGFARLPGLYLAGILKKNPAGNIAGRMVYGVGELRLIPITYKAYQRPHAHTKRYKSLFTSIDFTKDFFFSFHYDLTHSLQDTLRHQPNWPGSAPPPTSDDAASRSLAPGPKAADGAEAAPAPVASRLSVNSAASAVSAQAQGQGHAPGPGPDQLPDRPVNADTAQSVPAPRLYNDMFVWNTHLAREFLQALPKCSYWLVALVHGFFAQHDVRIGAHELSMTLLARRSRHFAGTRYLKRGIDHRGHVANEVESELILQHRGARPAGVVRRPVDAYGGSFASVVVMRGSIPLFWTQERPMDLRPIITVFKQPDALPVAQQHFDSLFERYGSPVTVLNLIRKEEKVPNESHIGKEFTSAIAIISTTYRRIERAAAKSLRYQTYDFNGCRKAGHSVLRDLKNLVGPVVEEVGFFLFAPHGVSQEHHASARRPADPGAAPLSNAAVLAAMPRDAPLDAQTLAARGLVVVASQAVGRTHGTIRRTPTVASRASAQFPPSPVLLPIQAQPLLQAQARGAGPNIPPFSHSSSAELLPPPISASSSPEPRPASGSGLGSGSGSGAGTADGIPADLLDALSTPSCSNTGSGSGSTTADDVIADFFAGQGSRSPPSPNPNPSPSPCPSPTQGDEPLPRPTSGSSVDTRSGSGSGSSAETTFEVKRPAWREQHGVYRVNCIDCLDRTNVAQFTIVKSALRSMLHTLGVTPELLEDLPPELNEPLQTMFRNHGDRIARQYAGSGAMHKEALLDHDQEDMAPKKSSAAEHAAGVAANLASAVKRYYSNNVTDVEKQHAINIFLGNYIPTGEKRRLQIWEQDISANHSESDAKFGSADEFFRVPFSPWVLADDISEIADGSGAATSKALRRDDFMCFIEELYDGEPGASVASTSVSASASASVLGSVSPALVPVAMPVTSESAGPSPRLNAAPGSTQERTILASLALPPVAEDDVEVEADPDSPALVLPSGSGSGSSSGSRSRHASVSARPQRSGSGPPPPIPVSRPASRPSTAMRVAVPVALPVAQAVSRPLQRKATHSPALTPGAGSAPGSAPGSAGLKPLSPVHGSSKGSAPSDRSDLLASGPASGQSLRP